MNSRVTVVSLVRYGVLTGFSIKFDLEQHCIVEIALINAPTFQADEDISVQQEIKFGSEIDSEINRCKSLNELERHLEHFLNRKFDADRLEKVRVDRIHNLRIEIHTDDHPPPHFYVYGNGNQRKVFY